MMPGVRVIFLASALHGALAQTNTLPTGCKSFFPTSESSQYLVQQATQFSISFPTDSIAIVQGLATVNGEARPQYAVTTCTSTDDLNTIANEFNGARIFVATPDQLVSAKSTTHVPFIEAMDPASLKAFPDQFYLPADVQADFATRNVLDHGPSYALNFTLAYQTHALTLVVMDIFDTDAALRPQLGDERANTVLFFDEARETTPLGRLEWIKVLGLIYDKAEQALDIFSMAVAKYDALTVSGVVGSVDSKPRVARAYFTDYYRQYPVSGYPQEDLFFFSAPDSYETRLILDASGDYQLPPTATPDPFGVTSLYMRVPDAIKFLQESNVDVLLNFNVYQGINQLSTYEEMVAALPGLAEVRAFKCGNVWADIGTLSFYNASFYPDVRLTDYIQALHVGGQASGYSIEFMRRVQGLEDADCTPTTTTTGSSGGAASSSGGGGGGGGGGKNNKDDDKSSGSDDASVGSGAAQSSVDISDPLIGAVVALAVAVVIVSAGCALFAYRRGRAVASKPSTPEVEVAVSRA